MNRSEIENTIHEIKRTLTSDELYRENNKWISAEFPSIKNWMLKPKKVEGKLEPVMDSDIVRYIGLIFYTTTMTTRSISKELSYLEGQLNIVVPEYRYAYNNETLKFSMDKSGRPLTSRFYPVPRPMKVSELPVENIAYPPCTIKPKLIKWLVKLARLVWEINFVAIGTKSMPSIALYMDRDFTKANYQLTQLGKFTTWVNYENSDKCDPVFLEFARENIEYNPESAINRVYRIIEEGIDLVKLINESITFDIVNHTEYNFHAAMLSNFIAYPLAVFATIAEEVRAPRTEVTQCLIREAKAIWMGNVATNRVVYPVIYHPVALKISRGYRFYNGDDSRRLNTYEVLMESYYASKIRLFSGIKSIYHTVDEAKAHFGEVYGKTVKRAIRRAKLSEKYRERYTRLKY